MPCSPERTIVTDKVLLQPHDQVSLIITITKMTTTNTAIMNPIVLLLSTTDVYHRKPAVIINSLTFSGFWK